MSILNDYKKIIKLIASVQPDVLVYTVLYSLTQVLIPYLLLWLSADLINNLAASKTFVVVATRAVIFLVAIGLLTLLSSWLDAMRGKRMDLFNYKVTDLSSVKLMNLSCFQLQDAAMRE